jgi:hypothetical protein
VLCRVHVATQTAWLDGRVDACLAAIASAA